MAKHRYARRTLKTFFTSVYPSVHFAGYERSSSPFRESPCLSLTGMESFAQFGEDLLAWEYFGQKRDGFFVEVGANHPTELSQTWFLEQRGWRGMLVEALPECCRKLREVRKGSIICETAVGRPNQVGEATFQVAEADAWSRLGETLDAGAKQAASITVKVSTLESLCQQNNVPHIDLLSIDIEGMELDALQGFDLRKRLPTVLILEDHLDSIDLLRYMWSQGYRLGKRTGCNNWWLAPGARDLPQTLGEKLSLWNRILFRKTWSKLRSLSRPPSALRAA
jgi:FkbM family methyltransferase